MPSSRKNPVDPASVMSDYFDYVQQYRTVSAALNESADVFLPGVQMRGQLIELAVKTYICATGDVVEGHDLEALVQCAVNRGLNLSQADWSERITPVNKLYCYYVDWDAKYLSRYPTPDRGMGAWVTPGYASLDKMIVRIVEQARAQWDQR